MKPGGTYVAIHHIYVLVEKSHKLSYSGPSLRAWDFAICDLISNQHWMQSITAMFSEKPIS